MVQQGDTTPGRKGETSDREKGEKSSANPRHTSSELTALLNRWAGGDEAAGTEVAEQVYRDLHHIALRQLAGERADHTLQATALISEVYLKLAELRSIRWQNRRHFFGSAANMIRRILVDYARRSGAVKRGGQVRTVSLEDAEAAAPGRADELLFLDQALLRLEQERPSLAAIVEYRFFGGLTANEIADLLNLSPATVKRRWRVARAWLLQQAQAETVVER